MREWYAYYRKCMLEGECLFFSLTDYMSDYGKAKMKMVNI